MPKSPRKSNPARTPVAGARIDLVAGLLVGVAAISVFILTLAPTVTAEDSGELIAAAWHFGVPHPPGYPLWTLLCGVFTHVVPFGSVAYRANLFSAVCAAAAGGVAFAAIRELDIARPAAAAGALVWVLGRWSWMQSVITEVYGLNSLMTAGLLWCALRWYRTRNVRLLFVACVLLGLGMCNHHTIALAGAALAVWILVIEPKLIVRWRLVLACTGGLIVGLLPYLYLPIRAAAAPVINWGNPSNFERFVNHVTRKQYGAVGPIKTVEPRSVSRLAGQVGYAASAVADDMTPWTTAAAGAGCLLMAVRRRWLLLLVGLWLTGTGLTFVVLANYDLDRVSQWAMRVFLIPVSLGLAIPLAVLLDWVYRWLMGAGGSRFRAVIVTVFVTLAAPAAPVVSHWRHCDYSNYWLAYDHGRNLLSCMLPNAMIFPSGDHCAFPLVYLVHVERTRADVLIADMYGYVVPKLVTGRPADSPDSPEAWLIKKARRPVYYAVKKSPPVANARFVTAGMLYHLLPEGMAFSGEGLFEQCNYRNWRSSTVMDMGARHIHVDYYFFAGLNALEEGNADDALSDFAGAAEYGRGIKEAFNNIGSALAEHGQDAEAEKYLSEAAGLDGRYLTPRWNLFRLSAKHARWDEARRWLTEIIAAAPDDARGHAELGFLLSERFGDPEGANAHWRESLRLDGNQPRVRAALSGTDR